MEKATISFLIGLMVIVIVIESTAMFSAFPINRVGNTTPPLSSAIQNTNTALPAQQAPVQTTSVSTQPTLSTTNSNTSLAPIQKANVTDVPTIASIHSTQYVKFDDPLPDSNEDFGAPLKAVNIPIPTVPEEDFVEIFHENQVFVYNSTAISFNLLNAPMKISYNVTPRTITDEKWIINRDAGKKTTDGKIINVTRFDEASWFQFTAFDKNKNGTIVMQDGFGKLYGQDTPKELVIRNPGNYQLKFEGNFVSVDIVISVPREGNIAG